MSIIKQIPNFITCLNLVAGCFSIVYAANAEFVLSSYCIFIAVLFDFLDGFTARLLNVQSDIGKQLDSLADMVTFGVAPGLLLYHFLTAITSVKSMLLDNTNLLTPLLNRPSFNLDDIFPFIAFLIPVFAALRLAKFNIDVEQQFEFRGLASPGCALFIAGSLLFIAPILSGLTTSIDVVGIDQNSIPTQLFDVMAYCVGFACLIVASLMLVPVRMFSFKFKNLRWKNNEIRFTFLALSSLLIIWAILMENIFVSVPIIILLYLLLSVVKNLFTKKNEI